MKFLLLLLITNFNKVFSNNDEDSLRKNIFYKYNKHVRPVKNYHDSLNVSMGLGVQNLESFNQMEETIDINLWVRMNWIDENLQWNSSISNLTFLSVDKSYTWVPDIELLNAASLPDIYTLNGGMNLYNNGEIMWSNPAVFKFSCGLELSYFPFDTQHCSMKFSSWIYNNKLLLLKPNDDISKQIDILDTFSHSEWSIIDVDVNTYDEQRPCCQNTNFSVNEYMITLKRFPHYYNISMGMTISLVIVNFIIMLIKPNNISRTSTGVFIPLTILALQLTLADKIPVVGYYTLMDYFFLCCFVTSMICSIESGLIFALLTTKSKCIYVLFKDFFDLDELIKKEVKKNDLLMKSLSDLDSSSTDEIDETEFEAVSNTVLNVSNNGRTKSYNDSMNNTKVINNNKVKILNSDIKMENDVIKTIAYDDVYLTLTKKEKLIFNEIEVVVKKIDNIFRGLIPCIFIVCISVIYSYKT
jgi:hypothetical protein